MEPPGRHSVSISCETSCLDRGRAHSVGTIALHSYGGLGVSTPSMRIGTLVDGKVGLSHTEKVREAPASGKVSLHSRVT
jgi:hypothetical protein